MQNDTYKQMHVKVQYEEVCCHDVEPQYVLSCWLDMSCFVNISQICSVWFTCNDNVAWSDQLALSLSVSDRLRTLGLLRE